jgi:hypothetical protein
VEDHALQLKNFTSLRSDAAKNDRIQEAEAYTEQISSIERRAEIIRRCFLLVLISLAGSISPACYLTWECIGKLLLSPVPRSS